MLNQLAQVAESQHQTLPSSAQALAQPPRHLGAQQARLKETLALLSARGNDGVSQHELATAQKVPPIDIYRQIGILRERGFPITTVKGRYHLAGSTHATIANSAGPHRLVIEVPKNGEYKAGNLRLILKSRGDSLVGIVGSPGEHLHLPLLDAQVLALLIKHRDPGVLADDICRAIGATHLRVTGAVSRLQKLELGVVIRSIEGTYCLATQGSPQLQSEQRPPPNPISADESAIAVPASLSMAHLQGGDEPLAEFARYFSGRSRQSGLEPLTQANCMAVAHLRVMSQDLGCGIDEAAHFMFSLRKHLSSEEGAAQ